MNDVSSRRRNPRGISTGGQFANERRDEATVALTSTIDVDALHPVQRERLDALVHEVAHDVAREHGYHMDDPALRAEEAFSQQQIADEAIAGGEQIGYLRSHGYDTAHVLDLISARGRKVS